MNQYGRTNDNNWNTPDYVWDSIKCFIPRDKVIWQPFYNDGHCGTYLEKLGFDVVHNDEDFWLHSHGDIVIDNPPYSIKGITKTKLKIMKRLISLGKPFMLLFPSSSIQTKFFKELSDTHGGFQFIIPSYKINFEKVETKNSKCLFYTMFVCWNMNLNKDIIMI